MFLTTGERSVESVFGRSVEDADGRPFEDGESITSENPIVAVQLGEDALPEVEDVLRGSDAELADLFESAVPAPLGGATFGTGVLSTPRAEVGGAVQNPFATEDLATVIQRDRVSDLLRQVGLTDAEDVEWIDGPREMGTDALVGNDAVEGRTQRTTFLDGDADVSGFVGVVDSGEGTDADWAVALHVARIQHGDDAVLAAGGHRTPRVTPPGWSDWTPRASEWLVNGAEVTPRTIERLDER